MADTGAVLASPSPLGWIPDRGSMKSPSSCAARALVRETTPDRALSDVRGWLTRRAASEMAMRARVRAVSGAAQGEGVAKAGRGDPWRDNELARRRRIRADARRPLGVNLAEGLALSEYLSTFAGSLRRR